MGGQSNDSAEKTFDLRYRGFSWSWCTSTFLVVVERLYKCSAAAICTEGFEVRLYGRYNSSFMCHKKAKNSVTQVYEENLSKNALGFCVCVSYSHIAMEQEQAGRRRLNRT